MSDSKNHWPQYQCHKIVGALQIKDILKTGRNGKGELTTRISFMDAKYDPIFVNDNFMGEQRPKIGGFLIKHFNGWLSYVSAEHFDQEFSWIPSKTFNLEDCPRTRLYPAYREGTEHILVDPKLVPPVTVTVGNQKLRTSPLKFNVHFSLLAVSQTDELIESGDIDTTDSIANVVHLDKIYLCHELNGIKKAMWLAVNENDDSKFKAPDGDDPYRRVYQNGEFIFHHPVKIDGYLAIYKISTAGTINLELGDTKVVGSITLDSVIDDDYKNRELYIDYVESKVGTLTLLGYDLKIYRINYNRRPS